MEINWFSLIRRRRLHAWPFINSGIHAGDAALLIGNLNRCSTDPCCGYAAFLVPAQARILTASRSRNFDSNHHSITGIWWTRLLEALPRGHQGPFAALWWKGRQEAFG
ncbi:uncharacterized protein LOC112180609 [Rosa chinensis]|uniref:uncharacterized protein LOC112180609 n=1 Tax=Rosa chinensis TaxID=74649 RepID=UPI001AD8F3EE|nr:uncharacterized protein LOC112180609 [Rosa chinensis]